VTAQEAAGTLQINVVRGRAVIKLALTGVTAAAQLTNCWTDLWMSIMPCPLPQPQVAARWHFRWGIRNMAAADWRHHADVTHKVQPQKPQQEWLSSYKHGHAVDIITSINIDNLFLKKSHMKTS